MKALGLDAIEFDRGTAEPLEHQFWNQFDSLYGLTEADMRKALPHFVTDPNNRAKVEALLSSDGSPQLE